MGNKRFDVVVVGNVGVDTNVYPCDLDAATVCETRFSENIDCVGQAGGYASRGFAALGKKTAFIGYVGEDVFGQLVRDEFMADGIDLSGLFIDPSGTARSINLMYGNGRRKNYYDGKNHMILTPDQDVCTRILAQSRLAHFNIPNWARSLLPAARERGLIISCDVQDMESIADPYLQDFIRSANILFFSAANLSDPGQTIEHLLRMKPEQIVVMGMGERGCAVAASGKVDFYDALELPDLAIDTNGAGDCLAVGFLASYCLDGYCLSDSIVRAQLAARHACTLRGTSRNLISVDQLNTYYQSYKHSH